jgi:hypothetical protein
MKKCNKCKLVLEHIKFAKNKHQKDGFENYCKSCKNTYNKRYGSKYTKLYLKKAGYGIYKLINKKTNEVYVGKGWLNERKVDHFTKLKAQKHSNRYLQSSYNTNPDFEFKILEKIKPELGHIKERSYILAEFKLNPKLLLNQHVTLRWE